MNYYDYESKAFTRITVPEIELHDNRTYRQRRLNNRGILGTET